MRDDVSTEMKQALKRQMESLDPVLLLKHIREAQDTVMALSQARTPETSSPGARSHKAPRTRLLKAREPLAPLWELKFLRRGRGSPLRSRPPDALLLPEKRMARLTRHFREALWLALEHDLLNTAKAAAYSGMLALFPALVVLTALLARVPEGTSLVGEVRASFEQILPADSMSLLQSALETRHIHSMQLIFSAFGLSVFAALGMMLSLMEGFRRAYRLPLDNWGFWQKRKRALALGTVPKTVLAVGMSAALVSAAGRGGPRGSAAPLAAVPVFVEVLNAVPPTPVCPPSVSPLFDVTDVLEHATPTRLATVQPTN